MPRTRVKKRLQRSVSKTLRRKRVKSRAKQKPSVSFIDVTCPVVGIGASAGGYEAVAEFLKHIPANTGLAFVVVQHLDPSHRSALPELFGAVAHLPVIEIPGRIRVEPDRVYVMPSNKCVTIERRVLKLSDRTEPISSAIDLFFESLAREEAGRAIGVVMSGTGTDGTVGLRAIKDAGGLTFAQSEQSAKFPGMPRNALQAGCVDAALSPRALAREIARIARHPHVHDHPAERNGPVPDENVAKGRAEHLAAIFAILNQHSGVDFSRYKQNTLERRMLLRGEKELSQYADFLRRSADETAAEEALRESEERLKAIVEQANAGIARYDVNGRIEFANQAFCKMLGYQTSELIGKNIREITHPDDVKKTLRVFERVLSSSESAEIEKRYILKDGSIIWTNVSDAAERDATGRPKFVVAVAVDITARKKTEAALERSRNLLEKLVQQRTRALRAANIELESEIRRRKRLEGQILEISEREQQRLGQELHDGLCQQLTAIGFMARATALRLKNHRVAQVEDLEKIAQLVNRSVMDARNIAHDLHKEEVDAAGFVDALRALTERKVWKTPCRLDLKTRVNLEDNKVASQLYRILREALTNANKHANATQIVVEVRRKSAELVFSVTDNGVGFGSKTENTDGLGFHIMQYRAQSIGAHLRLESPRNGGTRVVCSLPQPR